MSHNIRKIILKQGQSPGDILTFSRPAYDLKRAYPDMELDIHVPSGCGELFENNPYTTPLKEDDPDVEVYTITYDEINISGWNGLHFSTAFRHDIQKKINLGPKLFSLSLDVVATLDQETTSKGIAIVFSDNGCFLTERHQVSRLDTQKWLIVDGDITYTILKEKDKQNDKDIINVYSDATLQKWGYWEIPSTGILPELFVSDDEKGWYHQPHCTFLWDGPFWLINAGMKSDNALKQYHRWQEVVDLLNEYWQGKVRIVQIGAKSSSGLAHYHPQLTGVFNLVGQTDTRQLIRLAYHSEGAIGPISFQFVLMAAYEKPCVVAAGGKEGTRWHIYNHVRWVNKNGCLPCAMSDGCWKGGKKGKCDNLVKPPDMDDEVPLCFEMTKPQELADRVIDYYEGGRLAIPETELWFEDGKEGFEQYYQSGQLPEPEKPKKPSAKKHKPTWVYVKEAAALASVSEDTIRHWIKRGKIVGKKEKGRWLVDSKTL